MPLSLPYSYTYGITNSRNILSAIKTCALKDFEYWNGSIMTATPTTWKLVYEETDPITGGLTELILMNKNVKGQEMFVKFEHTLGDTPELKKIKCKIPHEPTSPIVYDSFSSPLSTPPSFNVGDDLVTEFHWLTEASALTNRELDTPIHYWISVNENRLVIILQGDPTPDFSDYKIAWAYFGAIKSFDDDDCYVIENIEPDYVGNVAMIVTSDTDPANASNPTLTAKYGERIGDGVNNVLMYKTKTGVKYQKHFVSFMTQSNALELEMHGFQASQWTHKYHLTPIYIIHEYDGFRGMLDGVVGVVDHNIIHLDELIVTQKDNSKDVYKFFDIYPVESPTKSPLILNSPNNQLHIAVFKEWRNV